MNYTAKYHLPQWEENDRIMRTDFNQMCADIASSIGKIEAKADAAYKPGNLPYVVGTYDGDGSTDWREFDLGFAPRVVIITKQQTSSMASDTTNFVLVLAATNPSQCWKLTGNGFAVSGYSVGIAGWINVVNSHYTYIAFR